MSKTSMQEFIVTVSAQHGRPCELRIFAPDPETAAAFALNSHEAKVELLGQKPVAVQVTQLNSNVPIELRE